MDNCCFNRPFDDQSDIRIRLKSEAKLEIQERIQEKTLELAWSYILDFENEFNPFEERKEAISKWRKYASSDIEESQEVLERARSIAEIGIRSKDANHIACAIVAGCGYFLTTDDIILKKMKGYSKIAVINPADFILGE